MGQGVTNEASSSAVLRYLCCVRLLCWLVLYRASSFQMALISSKSINGLDEVIFNNDPKARKRYKLNGADVPGVTTLIKQGLPTSDGLISWKMEKAAECVFDAQLAWPLPIESREKWIKEAKVAWKASTEEAADIGVAVHDYAELCSKGKREEALQNVAPFKNTEQWDQLVNALYKVDDFMKQNKDEMIATEAIVGSTKYGYAGRFDRLVRRGPLVIISDYKTSKSFYVEQFIQDAAYAIAVEEWLGIKVDGFEVIRFGKEGGDFKPLLITDSEKISRLKNQALRCLDTYKEMKWWSKVEEFKYK